METKVTIRSWRELLELAQNGGAPAVREMVKDDSSAVGCLLNGYLIYTSRPAEAKDLFAKARRSSDTELSQEAAVYEARCYEYLGQPEEGRILIRFILNQELAPAVRAHALFVLSVLQASMPKRALSTLDQISLDHVGPGLKGRIFNWRGNLQADLGRFEQALIEYAGATAFFEQAADKSGVAHTYNNRASTHRKLKQFEEAHASVDKALSLLSSDDPFLANFLDQKAQIFLAQQLFEDAEQYAGMAVSMVDGTDRQGVLCENLCTLGRAYTGQKNHAPAVASFERAALIAQQLDDPELLFKVTSARKEAAEKFVRDADVELAALALRMSDGSVRTAAKKLGVSHPGLLKLLARNSQKWKPKKPQRSIFKPLN